MMVLSLIVHNWWPLLFISRRERELLALSSSLMVAASFMAITDSVQNNCGGEASVHSFAAKIVKLLAD
jgi:multisubunit Na+/H+ antiporter MnhB subunit